MSPGSIIASLCIIHLPPMPPHPVPHAGQENQAWPAEIHQNCISSQTLANFSGDISWSNHLKSMSNMWNSVGCPHHESWDSHGISMDIGNLRTFWGNGSAMVSLVASGTTNLRCIKKTEHETSETRPFIVANIPPSIPCGVNPLYPLLN